jgi:uncharacterized protein YbjT (DUF2867 family)
MPILPSYKEPFRDYARDVKIAGPTARGRTSARETRKGKELAKAGAEVVAADIDNADSLKKAYQGAYGAFCVTFL